MVSPALFSSFGARFGKITVEQIQPGVPIFINSNTDAGQQQDGGGVDEQHVLHHVGGEQKTFAGLIERRADREVENDERGVETGGLPGGVGGAGRGEPGAEGAGCEGVEPAEQDEASDEVGFVMPVGPINHGKIEARSSR